MKNATLPVALHVAVVLLLWHVTAETLQQGKTGRDSSCVFFILLQYDQNFSWYKLPFCFLPMYKYVVVVSCMYKNCVRSRQRDLLGQSRQMLSVFVCGLVGWLAIFFISYFLISLLSG